MAGLTEEEREQRRQELEWEKEEKLRAANQRKLAAESAARRDALRNRADALFSAVSKGARSAAKATASAATRSNRQGQALFGRLFKLAGAVGAFLSKLLVKTWERLSIFAASTWSVPVFILAAAACYVAITYFCGYRIFGLTAHPPTYQFYVCDYSVGFCSRLFVGAVIALFTDRVTITLMSQIINAAVCVSLIGQAVIAGLLLRTGLKNRSVPAALMGLLMMTNPLAVVENMSAPGLLDVYLLLLLLLWLAFLKTPLVALVTPVFCLVGMAIHYEFLFSFLPPMLTLLLYYAFFAEKRRVRVGRWLAFAGGSVVSASSFFYLVFLAKDHLRMTSDEFYQHMLSRFSLTAGQWETLTFVMGGPVYRDYFDYYIFGQYKGYDYFENIGDFFTFLKNWTANGFNAGMLRKDLLLFLPVFCLAAAVWGVCAYREKGIKKLPYCCFIAQALVLVPELIISTDIWRWVSAALLSQFVVFAVVYLDSRAPLHRMADHTRMKPAAGGVLLAAVAAFVITGFRIMK